MKFYRVLPDFEKYPEAWFLVGPYANDGEELDPREFCYGQRYVGRAPREVAIESGNVPVAFQLGAFDMPVVSVGVADILESNAENNIERFTVSVRGTDSAIREIVNAIHSVDCVDEENSVLRRWTPEDGRPDKVGQFREISRLKIDPSRVGGHGIFRIKGSLIKLIVSEKVMLALSAVPDLGVVFHEV